MIGKIQRSATRQLEAEDFDTKAKELEYQKEMASNYADAAAKCAVYVRTEMAKSEEKKEKQPWTAVTQEMSVDSEDQVSMIRIS